MNTCNSILIKICHSTAFLDTHDTVHTYMYYSVVCITLKQSGSAHVCTCVLAGPCHGKAQRDCVWAKWTMGAGGAGGGGGLTLSASCMPLGLR